MRRIGSRWHCCSEPQGGELPEGCESVALSESGSPGSGENGVPRAARVEPLSCSYEHGSTAGRVSDLLLLNAIADVRPHGSVRRAVEIRPDAGRDVTVRV